MDERARAQRFCRVHREGARHFQKRLDPPALRDAMVDGEDAVLAGKRQHHRRVEERQMVDRQHAMLARRGDIFLAFDLQAEQHAEQQVEAIAKEIGGQVAEQQHRSANVEQAERGDQHRLAQADEA